MEIREQQRPYKGALPPKLHHQDAVLIVPVGAISLAHCPRKLSTIYLFTICFYPNRPIGLVGELIEKLPRLM